MQQRRVHLAASILVCCLLLAAQGADKYTDENRPYEFGFTIEGQQHRHESKDKDGIIMGEFGFITADDVYHVTVYATDKEGRFKILSMKNIHLKKSPAPSSSAPPSARQGQRALALPPASVNQAPPQQIPSASPPTSAPAPFKKVSIEPPARSCSSCSIPTTTKVPPPASAIPAYNNAAAPFGVSVPDYQRSQEAQPIPQVQQSYPQQRPGASANAPNYPQQPSQVAQNYPQQASQGAQNYPQQPNQGAQNYPTLPNAQAPTANNYPQPGVSVGQNAGGTVPQIGSRNAYPGEQSNLAGGYSGGAAPAAPNSPAGAIPQPGVYGQVPQQELIGPDAPSPGISSYPQDGSGSGTRAPKQYNGPEQQFNANAGGLTGPQGPGSGGQPGVTKPTLFSAQMQIVDKNTDINALRPGEKEGLPPGLTKDDMTQLLYTFNYTVGFHGHFEEGYTNGVKKGYYFVTGRNGVKTRIDYVADDTGFHPKVSQEVLDLLSDEVPKPETEKDEKYGLKGYEFKWLYYPVESKGQ